LGETQLGTQEALPLKYFFLIFQLKQSFVKYDTWLTAVVPPTPTMTTTTTVPTLTTLTA
jgi:hypothetical protein